MVISKDQNKSFLSESDFALQVAETGIAVSVTCIYFILIHLQSIKSWLKITC